MITKENEAAVLAHNDPKASKPTDILAEFDAAVKRYDLRGAINAASLTPKDATRLLRRRIEMHPAEPVRLCTSSWRFCHSSGQHRQRACRRAGPSRPALRRIGSDTH